MSDKHEILHLPRWLRLAIYALAAIALVALVIGAVIEQTTPDSCRLETHIVLGRPVEGVVVCP